jgi:hypothetical protein
MTVESLDAVKELIAEDQAFVAAVFEFRHAVTGKQLWAIESEQSRGSTLASSYVTEAKLRQNERLADPVIDTANKFLVGARGEGLVIQRPPLGQLSKDDAILLAAWLVAMTPERRAEFEQVLREIEAS